MNIKTLISKVVCSFKVFYVGAKLKQKFEKMALLQKLLTDRDEVIVLHRNSIYCSCGGKYQDLSDAENHLVQHPRVTVTKVNEVSKIIFNFLSKISIAAKNIGGDVNQNSADFELDFAILKEVNMPEKVFCITLEEEDLNAGD